MHIDKKEVLRYLGYKGQGLDETTAKLLDECLDEINQIIRESYVYDIYDIEKQFDSIVLKDTNLQFHSNDLAIHLKNSDKCALMAATLGLEADKRIAYYGRMDLTRALILDACATTAIESLCDEVQKEIEDLARGSGYFITGRYSPGYGDLPITHQKDIIEVLRAYPRIGLTVNESSIMLPRKSVTALIGWQKREDTAGEYKCRVCKDKSCMYRRCGKDDEQNDEAR